RRTLHIPGKSFNLPVLREKDWKDLEFAVRMDVDYVGISFVRTEKEILEVKEFLRDNACNAKVIAKIETPEALKNIDRIIKHTDAVMIARGDMGVVLPLETVPIHQYSIIKKCKEAGRFVITATEMLESMKNRPLPTRAEVNDVFSVVAAGTDAVMLSGETTEGNYPIESISFMRRIVEHAENSPHRIIIS
ncbi:MAG: pyruvate kinase, partial [Spirochaetes bacterium]